MSDEQAFSDALEAWLASDGPKSLGALDDVFAEKTFAVAIVLLMLVSATPIPTGGITFVFQLLAALMAVQMVFGRHTVWVPARWRYRELSPTVTTRAIPFVARRLRWFERHSRPRGVVLFRRRVFMRLTGLVLLVFAVPAALAPPLSGLEILPALGAVVVALSIILEDIAIYVVGVVIGTGGIVLFVSVGAAVVRLVERIF